MGKNAPNNINVTNLFNGSTGVQSTFMYSTTNSVPLIDTIATNIKAAAANSSSGVSSLGGLVDNSLSS